MKGAVPRALQVCRRRVETSACLQKRAVSLFISMGVSICVPLAATFITGVIEQLVYGGFRKWSRQLCCCCCMGAFTAVLLPLIASRWSTKDTPKAALHLQEGLFFSLSSCLSQAFVKAGFLSDAHGRCVFHSASASLEPNL